MSVISTLRRVRQENFGFEVCRDGNSLSQLIKKKEIPAWMSKLLSVLVSAHVEEGNGEVMTNCPVSVWHF